MNVLVVGIVMLLVGVMPSWAQGDPAGVPWNQLSPGEQQLLQRFSDTWDQIAAAQTAPLGMGRSSGAP